MPENKRAKDEDFVGKELPIYMFEATYTYENDIPISGEVKKIKVTRFGINYKVGATAPSIDYTDSAGRKAIASTDMFYMNKQDAQAEIDSYIPKKSNEDDIRQVIIIRKDLGMRPGKLSAQCCHASLGALLSASERTIDRNSIDLHISNKDAVEWLLGRFTKVILKVDSEEELISVYNKADKLGIPCSLIRDAGFTVFHGVPTLTCAGIGPAKKEMLDSITKHLKLL